MSTMTPKLLLYGPQTRFPSMEEANHLHRVLASHTGLFQDIVATIDELSSLYQQLATSDPSLSKVPGVASLSFIQKWLQSGDLSGDVDDLPNVAALPLTVVLQTALYLKYMDRNGTTTDYKGSLQSCKQHGVQGFCTGFLSAAATAFSENEEQLGRNLGTSIRLAMCLGAYVDRNSAYAEPPSPAFALSIRWKEGNFSAAQVKKLLKDYPNVRRSELTIREVRLLTPMTGLYIVHHGQHLCHCHSQYANWIAVDRGIPRGRTSSQASQYQGPVSLCD